METLVRVAAHKNPPLRLRLQSRNIHVSTRNLDLEMLIQLFILQTTLGKPALREGEVRIVPITNSETPRASCLLYMTGLLFSVTTIINTHAKHTLANHRHEGVGLALTAEVVALQQSSCVPRGPRAPYGSQVRRRVMCVGSTGRSYPCAHDLLRMARGSIIDPRFLFSIPSIDSPIDLSFWPSKNSPSDAVARLPLLC